MGKKYYKFAKCFHIKKTKMNKIILNRLSKIYTKHIAHETVMYGKFDILYLSL